MRGWAIASTITQPLDYTCKIAFHAGIVGVSSAEVEAGDGAITAEGLGTEVETEEVMVTVAV